MREDFTVKKRAILIVLALLVAGDIALGFYSWELSNAPYTSQKDFEAQLMKVKVLRGDIKSAQDIKDDMPATRDDCEKFEKALPPGSTGSSSMASDLDEIAKKAGLQVSTLAVKPKDLPDHGVTEVDIDATISGDYDSVARFVNGLQRSQKFYIVDGLALSTDSQNRQANGPLRVAIHLRTYFREAA
jgi:type IV pilus assembly protein PilO